MWGVEHVIVREAEVGLWYVGGRFVRVVGPGRYRMLNLPWGARSEITRVDMRRRQIAVQGQEILTADALSVRLNVMAEYRVVDAPRALHTVASYEVALYTAVQLALCGEVQARTIDALLLDRSALGAALMAAVRPEAESLGLELTQVGVRDIILPGDVKRMLSQEIEAQRSGRAALVAAREETAATRARANTARLLGESPVLLRLREIEALAKIGEGMGNTVVVAVPNDMWSTLKGAAGSAAGPDHGV